MKGEKTIAGIWERLFELKEMQKTEEKVKKEKEILPETAHAKLIKVTVEVLLEIEEGILVICEDSEQEEKTGEDAYRQTNKEM